jgi:hypothetical protein
MIGFVHGEFFLQKSDLVYPFYLTAIVGYSAESLSMG